MSKTHRYTIDLNWSGKTDSGNADIRTYDRTHSVSNAGKPDLILTTDNKAVGDPAKLNPEDLLVSSLASCHMLSYLYVCALEGIVILDYTDHAEGIMEENSESGGSFTKVLLRPRCKVANASMLNKANDLHHKAHDICYIANSVNFEVSCEAECFV